MPPETGGGEPVNSPCAVIATRVSRRPITRASRKRSLDTQPATARCSSSPPLKPRSCPPPSAGRSMTTVWPRAQPSAVAVLARLSVRTSKFIDPPLRVAPRRAWQQRRPADKHAGVHAEPALRTGDLGTGRLPTRGRPVGRLRARLGVRGGLRRALARLQRGGRPTCAEHPDAHRV